MEHLGLADWLVIGFYLVGIVALGVWFGKDQRSTRDYFLGSKNTPWWGIGLSIVAAETSALTIIGVPGLAYGGDLTFIQVVLGYVIARVLLALLLVPHYFKGEIYSPYQLLADRFGPGARQTAGGFFLLSETLAAGVRVYVVCIPLQLMLGVDVLTAIVLFVALSLLYTYIGGVKAVIWTDAVQFVLFLAGGLFTVCYIPSVLPDGWSGAFKAAAEGGKLHWFNSAFSLSAPINIWMGILGGTVITLSSHGAEQLIVQRVLACRTVRDGRRALILSAVLILPLFLIFLMVGALLWVYYQQTAMAIEIPQVRGGMKANDFVFPIFMLTEVPHVLRGFLIVAILSAAMSSVSSALTSLASVSTMDFVKPLLRPRGEEFYLRFSKVSTIGWGLLLVCVAYLSREVVFVFNAAFSLRGLTSGALLGGVLMAIWMRRGRSHPVVVGMMTALGCMTLIQLAPEWEVTNTWLLKWLGGPIHWPWYTLIGTVVATGTALLVRRATRTGKPGAEDPTAE